MSGAVGNRKRLIRLTAGNLRQNHLYISRHLDFFPANIVGPPSLAADADHHPIRIRLEGLNETIETDIGSDARTGKPRRMFRRRAWVRRFFDHHELHEGELLALERKADRDYRLYPFDAKGQSAEDWYHWIDAPPPPGRGPTVLELFAGCGGMALGFKNAGYRTVLANEWDADACQTLSHNVTPRVAHASIDEIKKFPAADVVAGGPPCQGFSNLGERVPDDPRNQLWRHFMRAVKDTGCRAFVMENVPPLLKSAEYLEIVRLGESMGFRVVSKVLVAADFGVPQTRRRAIIVGIKRDLAPESDNDFHPAPTHADPAKRSLHTSDLPRWRTVRDAIGNMPRQPNGENWHIGRNPTAKSLKRYRCVPSGGNRFDLPRNLTPDCWIRKTKGGTDLFGRLWWDRPSVTIRTEFYKPEKGRYLHPEENRPITHREAALLQGFAESFEFLGSKIRVGVQIGNAVPPGLAQAIAAHLAQFLSMPKLLRKTTNGTTAKKTRRGRVALTY